ncbi:hypothetical protein DFH09DRAFT_1343872 [Mycena vulgaris]|nr:hypothetical protein DFH09DRAFT_1343872 [Mycena vulgaris]
MSYAARPTLPPLHTLNLLPPSYRRSDSATPSTSSRSPSPTPSDASVRSSFSTPPTSPSKLTLIPSSLAAADAVLLVPPPSAAHAAPLLLTGAALAHLRHPLAKGARLHPYRVVRRPAV